MNLAELHLLAALEHLEAAEDEVTSEKQRTAVIEARTSALVAAGRADRAKEQARERV